MRNRSILRRVFLNVSMTNRIEGLRKVAEDENLSIKSMEDGDFVFFVNANRTKLAALVGAPQGKEMDGGAMCYYKAPHGTKITLEAIRNIPKLFDGRGLNYDKALEIALNEALKRRSSGKLEVAYE